MNKDKIPSHLINTIIKSDAFELLKQLPDDSIDMILTDIPYWEVNRKSNWLRNLDKNDADEINIDLIQLMDELTRVCKKSIYVFCWFQQFSTIIQYFKEHDYSDRAIVWEKSNPSPMNAQHLWVSGVELCAFWKKKKANSTYNGWYSNSVLKYPTAKKIKWFVPKNWNIDDVHATPKNKEMFMKLIEKSSNPWDIVLDPFVWSWTTAVSAKLTWRKFICCDKDDKDLYVELWNYRLETNQ